MASSLNQGLLRFLKASPTPFHAVQEIRQRLLDAGFADLDEAQDWKLKTGGSYLVVRGGSALIAWKQGKASAPLCMAGAHTDSPCLKLKPKPQMESQGYLALGVESYGGMLLSTWFDRDLSLAGRVSYQNQKGQLAEALVDFARPLGVIPSLAIHLRPKANEGWAINKQKEMPPILAQVNPKKKENWEAILLRQLSKEHPLSQPKAVLGMDLSFYDHQPPALVGLNQEFITGARLDNLLSCYALCRALEQAQGNATQMMILTDHEEIGSQSFKGADGAFALAVLERIYQPGAPLRRVLAQGLLVSVDNAHGVHPNHAEVHETNHLPLLNRGPVIKVNANQRYSTSGSTAARFKKVAQEQGVPVQEFVTRSDLGCGSTIGPITAAQLGVEALDIGLATWAMHSIRETCGAKDLAHLVKVMVGLFQSF